MITQENNESFEVKPLRGNEIINVQIIIDTDKIINEHRAPSNDQNNPTLLGHQYQFMVVSNSEKIIGQENADLKFQGEHGDLLRFYVTPDDCMYMDAFLYGVKKIGGNHVFSDFSFKAGRRNSVKSNEGSSPIPPLIYEVPFYFYEAWIENTGTVSLEIRFALYKRVRGHENPILHGYFCFNPNIVI